MRPAASSSCRRHPFGQEAHKTALANVGVLEQEHGLQFGIGRSLVVQHFEGGARSPPRCAPRPGSRSCQFADDVQHPPQIAVIKSSAQADRDPAANHLDFTALNTDLPD
jgi:hypothetical protein